MFRNTSNISEKKCNLDFLTSQDEELVNTLEEFQTRVKVFGIVSLNLYHRVLTDAEIKKFMKKVCFSEENK